MALEKLNFIQKDIFDQIEFIILLKDLKLALYITDK